VILVIDNYDSFTYNLVQLLLTLGVEVEVRRNDVESVGELLSHGARAIVLSPGPGRPESAGVCLELLEHRPQVPILGVCLGHQAIGMAFGGVIERAPQLMHGKTSEISHDGRGIFAELPNPFVATRYHSLCIRPDSVPACLDLLAHSEDGTIMGMRHRELPYWGVQFHPESVLTEVGGRLMSNFLATI
jgi:anthranilate synthase/aminodeoxychorismate synthase-like glutamine amidotransferase